MTELDPKVQPEDHALYAGRWIACIGDQVVGQGGTPGQARHAAQASRFKETPDISYVSHTPPLHIHPFLEKLAAYLPPDLPIFVAGGAVRNALLGLPVTELDFILPKDAIQHARRIADHFGGAFYALDQVRDYGRVLIPQEHDQLLILDFAPIHGADLEDDLQHRDFTINAIAIGIQPPHPQYDPCGGAADLHARKLRTCSASAFIDDSIRILRAVRFALRFELRPDSATKDLMRSAVELLPGISGERMRDELFKLLESPKPAASLSILDRLGALEYIMPELGRLKGVDQTAPHIHDVWQHTLEVSNQLERIFEVLNPRFDSEKTSNLLMGVLSHQLGRYREQIAEHLQEYIVQGRSVRALIFLAAFYHDSGKPDCQEVDQDGRITFIDHEARGADLVTHRAGAFQLSNNEIMRLQLIVLNHLRPLWLGASGELPSRRAKYRFFRDTGISGVDICLLSLADTLATFGHTISPDTWKHQVEIARSLLEAWWEFREEQVSPPGLVDGNDLMRELNLKPGPLIGQLLAAIREAQATGQVMNKRQAYELARTLLGEEREA